MVETELRFVVFGTLFLHRNDGMLTIFAGMGSITGTIILQIAKIIRFPNEAFAPIETFRLTTFVDLIACRTGKAHRTGTIGTVVGRTARTTIFTGTRGKNSLHPSGEETEGPERGAEKGMVTHPCMWVGVGSSGFMDVLVLCVCYSNQIRPIPQQQSVFQLPETTLSCVTPRRVPRICYCWGESRGVGRPIFAHSGESTLHSSQPTPQDLGEFLQFTL
jgi:hypothetical protein